MNAGPQGGGAFLLPSKFPPLRQFQCPSGGLEPPTTTGVERRLFRRICKCLEAVTDYNLAAFRIVQLAAGLRCNLARILGLVRVRESLLCHPPLVRAVLGSSSFGRHLPTVGKHRATGFLINRPPLTLPWRGQGQGGASDAGLTHVLLVTCMRFLYALRERRKAVAFQCPSHCRE